MANPGDFDSPGLTAPISVETTSVNFKCRQRLVNSDGFVMGGRMKFPGLIRRLGTGKLSQGTDDCGWRFEVSHRNDAASDRWVLERRARFPPARGYAAFTQSASMCRDALNKKHKQHW